MSCKRDQNHLFEDDGLSNLWRLSINHDLLRHKDAITYSFNFFKWGGQATAIVLHPCWSGEAGVCWCFSSPKSTECIIVNLETKWGHSIEMITPFRENLFWAIYCWQKFEAVNLCCQVFAPRFLGRKFLSDMLHQSLLLCLNALFNFAL